MTDEKWNQINQEINRLEKERMELEKQLEIERRAEICKNGHDLEIKLLLINSYGSKLFYNIDDFFEENCVNQDWEGIDITIKTVEEFLEFKKWLNSAIPVKKCKYCGYYEVIDEADK